MFSKQFLVADVPFERSSPSRLPVFTKYIPAFYSAKRPCHYTRFTVVIHLSSFMEDSENTKDHRVLPPLRSEKLLQYSLCRFVDTRAIVRPRFRTHFADILPNSQLMYTVQLLMIKGGLTLILSFRKAWFLLRIRSSNFCCFLHHAF